MQIHGGNGYHRDYSVERGYRDSRINRIFEGTNEINRLLATGMLLKRAAQGRLALRGGIAAAAAHDPDAAPAAPGSLPGGDTVDQAKRCTLAAIDLAYQRFGADFEHQQEVAAALSDLLMAVYALESAVLRTQKLAHGERRAHALDILAVLSQTTMNLVRERAELILGACCAGDALEVEYRKLQRLARTVPADLPAARDRIAQRVLAAGGYCG